MNNTKLNSAEFNVLVTGFERELIKEVESDSYVSEHTRYLKEFLSYAEDNGIYYIKQIDQSVVSGYVSYLHQRRNQRRDGTLAEATINKHKISILKFWKYLDAEEIKTNDIKLRQKRIQQEDPTVLTHQEIEQLYSVCDESAIGYRDRAMLALYYGCGLRKSEGLRLLLTDIDFSQKKIRIRFHSGNGNAKATKTKNNRERYVMMSPKVQEHIEEYIYNYRDFYLAEHSTYENFFIGERGTPVKPETLAKRIEALWKRVKDKYGSEKHIGLHTLRHTLGTHLYMVKMNIETIALMLGHQRLESTQLYIHSANQLKNRNNNE